MLLPNVQYYSLQKVVLLTKSTDLFNLESFYLRHAATVFPECLLFIIHLVTGTVYGAIVLVTCMVVFTIGCLKVYELAFMLASNKY